MNIASIDTGSGAAEESRGPQWGQAWMKTLEQVWRQQPQPRHCGREAGGASAAEPAQPDALQAPAPAPSGAADAWLPFLAAAMAFQPAAATPSTGEPAAREPAAPAREPGTAAQALAPAPAGQPASAQPALATVLRRDTRDGPAAAAMPRDPLPERHVMALPEAGGVAVWVRDASLDEAGREQLAQRLRRALLNAGLDLQRVAVNGRTVYESAAAGQSAPVQPRS